MEPSDQQSEGQSREASRGEANQQDSIKARPATPWASPQAPAPSVEINLPNQGELDRDPEAFGRTVTAAEEATPGSGGIPPPITNIVESPYNPDESRDATRQTITLWLLGLLCAIISLIFVVILARGASTGFRDPGFFSEMKQILDLIVGPIITLLASAIGFYFGSKQAESNTSAKSR